MENETRGTLQLSGQWKNPAVLAPIASGLLLLTGWILSTSTVSDTVTTVLYLASLVTGGYFFGREALEDLIAEREIGIDLLMAVAAVVAALTGQLGEGAMLAFLYSISEAAEEYTEDKTRSAIRSLMSLAPATALVRRDGEETEIAAEDIEVGDIFIVKPGESIPTDGEVQTGRSSVDQSPVTGESVPVDKSPDDVVFAGTINTSGTLRVEMTRRVEDTTLHRMVEMVQEAQSEQAPVQRFIDRFARYYTPAVAGVAILVAGLPPLLLGQPFLGENGWLMRALQMLVIACPCALVISTPVTLVSAMANAASKGILVKGGRHIETLNRVTAFAFDKTGTLTIGEPTTTDVIGVCQCGKCMRSCGLEHAAALETQSSHPLAQALVNRAREEGIEVPRAQDVSILSGRGIEGTVNGRHVTVGSHAHFEEFYPHPEFVCELADRLSNEGKTVVMVQHDNEVCSIFGVADAPRLTSRQAIEELNGEGYQTVMLTGDNPSVAAEIGRQVAVDEVKADLLPEEKVKALLGLRSRYQAIAMVGDGVNDAPALARADVGIAMGGAGTAQAMETADIVLMADDLAQLPFLVRLSHRTMRVVQANIVFALLVKATIFGLAAAGLASLWVAIAADVGASLMVILNGLRMRRVR